MLYLENAAHEIERFGDQLLKLLAEAPDEVLWQKSTLPNSIGVIARHLAGNLNHYLGAGVLQNGYQRQRENEFHGPPLPREVLIADLETAIAVARTAIGAIDGSRAQAPHTTPCGEHYDSLAYLVTRLTTHFAYHTGEAYYASKLLAKS